MCFITLFANEAAMKQSIANSPVCLSVCVNTTNHSDQKVMSLGIMTLKSV